MIPGLDPDACRERRRRLLERARQTGAEFDGLLISRPEHVYYLSGFLHDPNNIHHRAPQYLLIDADGGALVAFDGMGRDYDSVLAAAGCEALSAEWFAFDPLVPRTVATAGAIAAEIERRGISALGVESAHLPLAAIGRCRVVVDVEPLITRMRRRKDADEMALIRATMKVGERFHSAARERVRPGLTEVELYAELVAEATKEAEQPIVMRCDFRAGAHMRMGGTPTNRLIEPGDNLLMDIYPYMKGYDCDITNTLTVGGKPTAQQQKAMDAAIAGLKACEDIARPGVSGDRFYQVQTDAIAEFDPDWKKMQGHAGHALGLEHPEGPDFRPGNGETITEGDVITFEPHVFGDPFQGCRIEHNYLVTADGLERLSNHEIGLC